MIERKIIIVDDDPIILEVAKAALVKTKYEVFATTSPVEALEEFKKNPTLVFLSDLNMPVLTGMDLLNELNKLNSNSTFIILTAKSDINTAIELFQKGIHDYILKPFSTAEFTSKIDKAFEFAEMKLINENIKKERETRIEHQLNWNLFKEGLIKKDTDRNDSGLMTSINSSLVQGAGLGALSPLVRLIKDTSILEGEFYKVDKELIDTLFETTKFSDKLIYMIGDIDYIINNEIAKEKFSLSQVKDLILNIVEENKKFINLRQHQVRVSETNLTNPTLNIEINTEYFSIAIKELLLNALKFSDSESKIYFLFEVTKENFCISILNTPAKDSLLSKGIQPELQSLIFEPFFRIARTVHEEYQSLDFGLGLTYVEKIFHSHKGKMRITNLKNFLENLNTILISFTIELPYSK